MVCQDWVVWGGWSEVKTLLFKKWWYFFKWKSFLRGTEEMGTSYSEWDQCYRGFKGEGVTKSRLKFSKRKTLQLFNLRVYTRRFHFLVPPVTYVIFQFPYGRLHRYLAKHSQGFIMLFKKVLISLYTNSRPKKCFAVTVNWFFFYRK